MTTRRLRPTLPIRRWLALALVALFLAPLLTLGVMGFFLFRDQQGPWDPTRIVETRITDQADHWQDPTWQSTLQDDLTDDDVDVVLHIGDEEVFRTSSNPLGESGNGSRLVKRITVPDTASLHTAEIYSDPLNGPPEELREWFVPVAVLSALVLTLTGIAWFLGQSIVRPLTATSTAARKIADGDLAISLPASRVREVADLNQAFASMSDGLRSSIQAQATMEQDRRLFISAIAHDLRTPLFSLRGSLEGLEKGIANTPEKRARYIAIAQSRADALERLISDLFAFTRIEYMEEEPARTRVELDALLTELIEELQPRAEARNIRLLPQASPTPVTVLGDGHLLTRVVENLLDNALRHTPEGGTVRVAWQASGTAASISVTDTGVGIPESELPHLFEPLYRGESSRNRQTGGAGLGLTIARRIMEAHGGTLVAGNSATGGAVFTATMPKGG